MRLPRKVITGICQVLVGMLLFTQAAFAARPCVEAGMSAASALAASDEHECCETSVTEINLCVMQCTDSDKLSAHVPLVVPAAPSDPVLKLAVQHTPRTRWAQAALGTAARDPPKTIRFCSLLI